MRYNIQPKPDAEGTVHFTYFEGTIRCPLIQDPNTNLGSCLELEVLGEERYLEVLNNCVHHLKEYLQTVLYENYSERHHCKEYLVSLDEAVDVINKFKEIYNRDHNLIKKDLFRQFYPTTPEFDFLSVTEQLVNNANSIQVGYYPPKTRMQVKTNLIHLELLVQNPHYINSFKKDKDPSKC